MQLKLQPLRRVRSVVALALHSSKPRPIAAKAADEPKPNVTKEA